MDVSKKVFMSLFSILRMAINFEVIYLRNKCFFKYLSSSGIFIFEEVVSYSTLFGAFLIIIRTAIIFRSEAVKKVKTTIIRQI